MTGPALVMIACDEAGRIGRALASARPFVGRMVVVDTGSVDATPAVAAACGAEVHRFAWRDDFSAARNAALDIADADWSLVLDADEWLESGGEALAGLAERAPFLGEARIENRVAVGAAAAVSTGWIVRLLPRGVRYAGAIHEQPQSALPPRRLSLTIGHDGYLPEALARKAARNEAMLRTALAAAPQDGYLWFQLGRQLTDRDAREAADCFRRAHALAPPGARFRHPLVLGAIAALKAACAHDEARALADREAAAFDGSPDFWFVVGDLYLDWASRHPERAAAEGLPICEYAWKRCLEIGERDDLDGAVRGRGGVLAAQNLAAMYETFGMAEQAATYRAMAEDRP